MLYNVVKRCEIKIQYFEKKKKVFVTFIVTAAINKIFFYRVKLNSYVHIRILRNLKRTFHLKAEWTETNNKNCDTMKETFHCVCGRGGRGGKNMT